jgi:hypothetical protein
MEAQQVTSTYAEQIRICAAHSKSSRAYARSHEEKNPHVRLAIHRRYFADVDNLKQMRAAERARLATERGWIVSRRSFTLQELKDGRFARLTRLSECERPIIDHPDCFVLDRKPAAIVSHMYAPWEQCSEFAQLHGLDAERLYFSWHYPNGTLAVIFTRRQPSIGGVDRATPETAASVKP